MTGRRSHTQHAPRLVTILGAVVLVLIGFAGTFLGLLPAVGGVTGSTLGVAACVAATGLLLIGIFFRRL